MIDSYTMECNMGLHESKTNADMIRSMTDEELAEFISEGDYSDVLEWLKKEIE